jgi:hypothetical protein
MGGAMKTTLLCWKFIIIVFFKIIYLYLEE